MRLAILLIINGRTICPLQQRLQAWCGDRRLVIKFGNILSAIDNLTVIIIDRVAGEVIRLVAFVCVRVRLLWALSCLNRLTLIFVMRVDLDLG